MRELKGISDSWSLRGKNALITGGAGFLGQEFAAALLDLSCTVVLADISAEQLMHAESNLQCIYPTGRIITIVMDVTCLESIHKARSTLSETSINVDILVNNAAINPKVQKSGDISDSGRLESFSQDSWEKEISVGLTGAFLCTQVFGGQMASRGGGSIVNIASDLGVIAPTQRLYERAELTDDQQPKKPITYSVIKHGLIGLTKYTATYWAHKGVRCNALSPGGVWNNQGNNFLEKISELIPLGRMCNSSELRGALQYLCSDVSSYTNGHNLVVDGGRSIW